MTQKMSDLLEKELVFLCFAFYKRRNLMNATDAEIAKVFDVKESTVQIARAYINWRLSLKPNINEFE